MAGELARDRATDAARRAGDRDYLALSHCATFFRSATNMSIACSRSSSSVAQDGGRMRRQRDELGEVGVDRPAPVAPDPDVRAEQRLRGGGAEADQRLRLDDLDLGLEPREAGRHLPAIGLLVDPALAPELVAEMLDRVRDVDVLAGDAGPLEALVEHFARGADERMSLDVLAVAGLLADQHQAGACGALAHDRLGGAFPQVAGAAVLHGPAQVRQASGGRVRARAGSVERAAIQLGPYPRHEAGTHRLLGLDVRRLARSACTRNNAPKRRWLEALRASSSTPSR